MTPKQNSLHSKRRRRDLAARFGKSTKSKLNKRIDLAATAKRRQKLRRSRNNPRKNRHQKRKRVMARMTPQTTSSPRCSAHPTRKVKSNNQAATRRSSSLKKEARRRVHPQPKKVPKRKSQAPKTTHQLSQSREVKPKCRLRRMLTAPDSKR